MGRPDLYGNYLEELRCEAKLLTNTLAAQRAALDFDIWWRGEYPLSEEPEDLPETAQIEREPPRDTFSMPELSEEVHRLTQARIQLAEELAHFRLENEELRQDRLEAETRFDELQRQLASLQQAYESNLRHLERHNMSLAETNGFLEAEHSRLASRLEFLEHELLAAGKRAAAPRAVPESRENEEKTRALVQFLELKIQEIQGQREDAL